MMAWRQRRQSLESRGPDTAVGGGQHSRRTSPSTPTAAPATGPSPNHAGLDAAVRSRDGSDLELDNSAEHDCLLRHRPVESEGVAQGVVRPLLETVDYCTAPPDTWLPPPPVLWAAPPVDP